jgi:hypothetical protein
MSADPKPLPETNGQLKQMRSFLYQVICLGLTRQDYYCSLRIPLLGT